VGGGIRRQIEKKRICVVDQNGEESKKATSGAVALPRGGATVQKSGLTKKQMF